MARSHFPQTSHLGGVAPAVLGRGHFPWLAAEVGRLKG
jgi:hypothetical protein